MTRHWWKPLLIVLGAVLLVGICGLNHVRWSGRTDLEVKFVVRDIVSGRPIPGARIEVQLMEGVPEEERDKALFVLTADESGVARKECPESPCTGERSGLGFTDTFYVSPPWWRFRVKAEGFEPRGWTDLVPAYQRQGRRVRPGKALLVVPVSMLSKDTEAGDAANHPPR